MHLLVDSHYIFKMTKRHYVFFYRIVYHVLLQEAWTFYYKNKDYTF